VLILYFESLRQRHVPSVVMNSTEVCGRIKTGKEHLSFAFALGGLVLKGKACGIAALVPRFTRDEYGRGVHSQRDRWSPSWQPAHRVIKFKSSSEPCWLRSCLWWTCRFCLEPQSWHCQPSRRRTVFAAVCRAGGQGASAVS